MLARDQGVQVRVWEEVLYLCHLSSPCESLGDRGAFMMLYFLISTWVCRRLEKLCTEQRNWRRLFKHAEVLKKEDEQLKMKIKRWRRKHLRWIV